MTKGRIPFVAAVQEFHIRCGYRPSRRPFIGEKKRRELWRRLVEEEARELFDALEGKDMVASADAIGDLLYVTIGAGLAFGFPIEELFAEVHRSNLTKLETRTEVRSDGKVLKGAGFQAPDIRGVLKVRSKDRARSARPINKAKRPRK